MKPLTSKGLLFIGMACAFQANAAIIQITEDRLTLTTKAWIFEERYPSFPPSENTLVAKDSDRVQSAFLGLNGTVRSDANAWGDFSFGYADRGAFITARGREWNDSSGYGFGVTPHPHLYINDESNHGYSAAGWESTSRFTVDGSDAILNIYGFIRGRTDPSDDYIGFELIDETDMLTLASLLPEEDRLIDDTFALQDGRSYSLTTTGYLRTPTMTDTDGEPQFSLWFDNATRATVPEPSTALLLLLGTLGMSWIMRGQRRSAKV